MGSSDGLGRQEGVPLIQAIGLVFHVGAIDAWDNRLGVLAQESDALLFGRPTDDNGKPGFAEGRALAAQGECRAGAQVLVRHQRGKHHGENLIDVLRIQPLLVLELATGDGRLKIDGQMLGDETRLIARDDLARDESGMLWASGFSSGAA